MERMESGEKVSSKFEKCITDCLDCYQSCTRCIHYCIRQGGEHVDPKHLALLLECSRICQLSSELMISGSSFSDEFCQMCARVCSDCARSCRDIDPEDQMMKSCAEICERCAESCRNMGH